MRKHFIQLLLTIAPCLIFAQRQFLDATLTTNDGQKISGKIAAENWLTTPRSIDFKSENGGSKTYRVSDLSAFEATRHDGGKLIFVRKECEIEISPYQLKYLDYSQELKFQKDTAWLQLVYQGSWSLFTLVDKNSKIHYFVETDNLPVSELVYKPFLKEQAVGIHIEGVEKFRKQLYDLAEGCPAALKLATESDFVTNKKLNLRKQPLVDLFKAYDKCNGAVAEYILKDEKMLLSGRIMAGSQFGVINLAPSDKFKFNEHNLYLGFGLELFLNNSNRRASIINEAIGYRVEEIGDYKLSFLSAFDNAKSSYSSWDIAVHTMGSIRITQSSLSPKLNIGVINRFHISPNFKTDYYIQDNLIRTEKSRNQKDGYEVGPAAGLSIEYHRLGLNVRYSISNYLRSWGLGENANTRMLAVGISYKVF